MPYRRSTLDQRKRRFLVPIIVITLPIVFTLISTPYLLQGYCDFARRYVPNAECNELSPFLYWGLAAFAIGALLYSGYRFYRDHIIGEAYYSHF